VFEALKDPDWVEAMHEELNNFKRNKVWTLVEKPKDCHNVIRTKWVFDTSQTYLQFLMLHACFYTIYLVFRYTSWRFYAISETNLLTRCHSASSLVSAVFVFQKSYTGNILEIGQNKFLKSYFSRKRTDAW
jgi:hypothetical protein